MGQEHSRIKEMLLDLNMDFKIDLNDYYLCVTGIEKRFYSTRLEKSRTDFAKLYKMFKERIKIYGGHLLYQE